MNKIIKNGQSLYMFNFLLKPKFLFSTETDLQLKSAQKYVNEQFRSRSWSTYVLENYYPKQLRMYFATINMFDLQLIRIVESSRQPSLALGKMDFWRETIQKIYRKQITNKQPISLCLADACKHNPLTKGYLLRLINARSQEIVSRQIDNMQKMLLMAQHSKGTLIALNLQLLRVDIKNEHMEKVIGHLGKAIGICQYLRRVPYGLRNNKFLVPADILMKYNLQPRNIWDRTKGRPSEFLFDAVLQIAAYAKRSFQEAIKIYEANPASFPQQSFRAFLKGIQTQMYLQDLQKFNFNLFEPGLNKNHPFKLPYLAYNAAKVKKFYTGSLLKR